MKFSETDQQDLVYAKQLLEHPGLASKMMNVLGRPLEIGMRRLPAKWSAGIMAASHKALIKALDVAVKTLDDRQEGAPEDSLHRMLAAASGGIGGLFGLSALALELPVSTIIMLRAIGDIARSQGEDIKTVEARLACLEVFALGGRSAADDSSESGYFAVRAGLAKAVADAAKYIANRGVVDTGAPALVRLIASIASRFGVVVSEKAAAMAIPVVGAAGGALVNTIFIDHFQDVARGHFIIRRLERTYGRDLVAEVYKQI